MVKDCYAPEEKVREDLIDLSVMNLFNLSYPEGSATLPFPVAAQELVACFLLRE